MLKLNVGTGISQKTLRQIIAIIFFKFTTDSNFPWSYFLCTLAVCHLPFFSILNFYILIFLNFFLTHQIAQIQNFNFFFHQHN